MSTSAKSTLNHTLEYPSITQNSVSLSVCLSVCLSLCLWTCLFHKHCWVTGLVINIATICAGGAWIYIFIAVHLSAYQQTSLVQLDAGALAPKARHCVACNLLLSFVLVWWLR